VTVPPELVSSSGSATEAPVSPPTPASGLTVFSPSAPPTVNGHANGTSVNGSTNGATNGAGLPAGLKPSPLPRRSPASQEPAEPPKPAEAPESTSDPAAPAEPDALPRRSPGTRMPGATPGSASKDRPGAQSERPADRTPATGLFTPAPQDTGWWTVTGPGRPVDPRALEETTPIFDEMISAWFRTVADQPASAPPPTPEPPRQPTPPRPAPPQPPAQPAQPARSPQPARPAPQPQPSQQDDDWRFAADSGFTTARAVSRSEPESFTENGLPRRSAGQHLIPGSAGSTTPEQPRHGRAAEDMRVRLSDYRHGVRRARDHRRGMDEGRDAGRDGAGTEPGARPVARNPGGLDLSGAGWRFAADVGWHAANTVSTSTPVNFTSGGLPRRSAGEHLVPGSVAPAGGGPLRPNRAEELRGRLGSFQKGLSRGRRSLAERGTANGYPENKQQESE
jgi:hypothetical protein